MKKTRTEIVREQLTQFVDELRKNGYRVAVRKDKPVDYLHFTDGKSIVYVQGATLFTCFTFSKNYKPTPNYGTGTTVLKETDLTIENDKIALNSYVPYPVKFWASLEQMINSPSNRILEYTILEPIV